MTTTELEEQYRRYINCLNERPLTGLAEFVHEQLLYNGKQETRSDYQARIAENQAAIPDLRFNIAWLVVSEGRVGCRLFYHCTPQHEWLGLQPTGKSISFVEHVFYEFQEGKIAVVWSLLDVPAIAEQLRQG